MGFSLCAYLIKLFKLYLIPSFDTTDNCNMVYKIHSLIEVHYESKCLLWSAYCNHNVKLIQNLVFLKGVRTYILVQVCSGVHIVIIMSN